MSTPAPRSLSHISEALTPQPRINQWPWASTLLYLTCHGAHGCFGDLFWGIFGWHGSDWMTIPRENSPDFADQVYPSMTMSTFEVMQFGDHNHMWYGDVWSNITHFTCHISVEEYWHSVFTWLCERRARSIIPMLNHPLPYQIPSLQGFCMKSKFFKHFPHQMPYLPAK